MTRRNATSACTPSDAAHRAQIARAYLATAQAVLTENRQLKEEYLSVAAGSAVLAGIAASDAICGSRLGKIHWGEDHRAAVDLLNTAVPDGKVLAAKLARLLDIKHEAHYGISLVSARRASDTIKWARALVDRATEEVER